MNADTLNGQNDRTGEMSTTDADLRGVLAEAIYTFAAGEFTPEDADKCAGLVLRTIDKAGHTVVTTDRLERLIAAAQEYEIELEWRCGEYLNVSRQCTSVLREGDLER